MDEIHLPVQYESFGIEGLKSHFRYITTLPKNGHCAEVYLHEPKVVIPITKTTYKAKADIVEFLLRSGSISRENLADLECTFSKQNYEIKVARTAKKRLIKRLSLTISIDDPMLPIIGVNILKTLTFQLNSKWPCEVSIGYAFGDETSDLPGKLKYRDILSQAGYKIGQTAARATKIFTKNL